METSGQIRKTIYVYISEKSTLLPRQRVMSQTLNNFSNWKANSWLTFLFAQDSVILIVPCKNISVYNDLETCLPCSCAAFNSQQASVLSIFSSIQLSVQISVKNNFSIWCLKKKVSFSSDTGTQSATHKAIVLTISISSANTRLNPYS